MRYLLQKIEPTLRLLFLANKEHQYGETQGPIL